MKTKIYIVRHAEASGNINGTFQGMTDCEISEKGKHQLELLKTYFDDIAIDAIYSSPLKRTMATAKAVNGTHDLPIQTVYDLHEINGGVWEGNSWESLPNLYPDLYEKWNDRPHEFHALEGESMQDVYDRMKNAVDTIARENEGKTVVVVSHGCAIRNFLCYATGVSFENLCDVIWLENTAVSLVEYDEKQHVSVKFINDTSHLSNEDMTVAHQTWWRTGKNDKAEVCLS